jgi:hypothetical protein
MLAVMGGRADVRDADLERHRGQAEHVDAAGIYRIRNKVALGAMRNRPEDAEESPYHVEAVPWVMYFDGRFALHGAYWHNGFGHRKSHGCVNLAPNDARYVYGLTSPDVPPGWISSYEHAGEVGQRGRVRKRAGPQGETQEVRRSADDQR